MKKAGFVYRIAKGSHTRWYHELSLYQQSLGQNFNTIDLPQPKTFVFA